MKKIFLLIFCIIFFVNLNATKFCEITSSPFTNGANPDSIAFSPEINGKLFAAATNITTDTVSVYSVNINTGDFTFIAASNTNMNPTSVAYSPITNEGNLFAAVANSSSSNVTVYTVNTTTGSFSAGTNFATGLSPSVVTFSPITSSGNLFAAVAHSGVNFISVFDVNTTTGAFTNRVDVPVNSTPISVAFSPITPGGNLFAATANFSSNNVRFFSVNTTNGTFTENPNSPISSQGVQPNSIAFSPITNEGNLFAAVVNIKGNNINAYSVDLSTGDFTQLSNTPVGNNPVQNTFSPLTIDNQLFAAVANLASNNISVFSVNSSGVFTEIPNSPFSTGNTPTSVAFSQLTSSNTIFFAVTNRSDNTISIFVLVSPPNLTSVTNSCNGLINVNGNRAIPGSVINVIADGSTNIGTGIADSSGNFNFNTTIPLSAGNHTIIVNQQIQAKASCVSENSNSMSVDVSDCSIIITTPTENQIFTVCGSINPFADVNVTGLSTIANLRALLISSNGQTIDFGTIVVQNGTFNFTISDIFNSELSPWIIRLESVDDPTLFAEVQIQVTDICILCPVLLDALSKAIADKYPVLS